MQTSRLLLLILLRRTTLVSGTSATTTFDEPFRLSSEQGGLFIEPMANASLRTRLHLKGANCTAQSPNQCDRY